LIKSSEDVVTKQVAFANIDNDCCDKSGINLDITRKFTNMMDFSVVLNKRNIDETQNEFLNKTGEFGHNDNEKHSIWDISCI
jgi:hypothetical protein